MKNTHDMNGSKLQKIFLLVFGGIGLLMLTCSQKNEESINEYFPMKVGSRWKYQIFVGSTKPIWHKYVGYLIGDTGEFITMTHRGKFIHSLTAPPDTQFSLVLRIERIVLRQGPVKTPGVEIAVDTDDLGVYEKNDQLFWSAKRSESPLQVVLEVTTYRSDRLPVPQGWGINEGSQGFSQRAAFFLGEKGSTVSFGRNPGEGLVYIGVESSRLHFTRFYEEIQDEAMDAELSYAFSEDLWFEKGKGLVRLEQKINGKISMTWNLLEFIQGK